MSFCCAVCVPTHLPLLNPRITAYGAAGGRSVLAMSRSYGVYITGDFLLRKGELLYILVGQQGEDACPNVSLIHYSSSFPVVGSVSPLLCGKSMSRITWTHSACHEKQDEHNKFLLWNSCKYNELPWFSVLNEESNICLCALFFSKWCQCRKIKVAYKCKKKNSEVLFHVSVIWK